MTNDIEALSSRQCDSLYCMFLNTQGRVLFDALIYQADDVFLIDVDQKCSNLAKKHLSMYKVRRNVTIDIDNQFSVFGAFNRECQVKSPETSAQSSVLGSTFCNVGSQSPGTGHSAQSDGLEVGPEVRIFPDPRLSALGSRILLDNARSTQISSHLPSDTKLCSPEDFLQYRCLLGVAEGSEEIQVGKTTPLEYNLDYLHGVSFHKGCYLGQELTARTHHTGVVRKRIVPLTLSGEVPPSLTDNLEDLNVLTETGKKVGKIKRLEGRVGLGLLRLKETFEAEKLSINGVSVSARKPVWWPADKENNITAHDKH